MDWMVRTCSTERMNIARLLARGFVIAGGLIWTIMLFASGTAAKYTNFTYTLTEVIDAGLGAAIPLSITVLVFVIALFYERIAAIVLLLATAGTVVYGVVAAWEGAVLWMSVLFVVVSPLVISAFLFMLAARTQRMCELEGVSVEG